MADEDEEESVGTSSARSPKSSPRSPGQALSVANVSELPGSAKPVRRKSSVWSRLSFAEKADKPKKRSLIGNDLSQVQKVACGKPCHNAPTNYLRTAHYSILSFLPLNLYEQFHQISNCYFFLNMVIALIPGISPIMPITAIIPLILVLTVAACKDGYEDWKRHQADAKDNASPVTIFKDGEWIKVPSRDIRPGDFLCLKRGESVKADVIVISSEDPDGTVFIETSQLDGESNVKPKKSRPETCYIDNVDLLQKAISSDITLTVDPPSDKLYRWQGIMHLRDEAHPLALKQAIWRGSSIRKTEWAICVSIYVGPFTKQGMNLKARTVRKISSLLVKLNALIGIIFGIKHVIIFFLSGLSVHWSDNHTDHWYAAYWLEYFTGAERFWLNYLTYFILFSFMIPISLFVTIEICKACQIVLMGMDHELMHWVPAKGEREGEWVPCRPKTSDLNEQLAVVRYIFSDKTGTLTENIMRYMKGVVASPPRDGCREWRAHSCESAKGCWDAILSGSLSPAEVFTNVSACETHGDTLSRFLLSMALCHTVVPFKEEKNTYSFEGSSPDEVALVTCASNNGFVLIKRAARDMVIKIHNTEHHFEIIEELEFTSTRKMMSVILRDENNTTFLLSKGADSSVLSRVAMSDMSAVDRNTANGYLVDYSSTGLRTLCFGWKVIEPHFLKDWRVKYNQLQTSMTKTEAEYDSICDKIEHGLSMIGVAAYEDKLQEEVPETIRFFVNAGVVVWMLTGDKLETGIEIGKNCGLADSSRIFLVDCGCNDVKVPVEERRKLQIAHVKSKLEEAAQIAEGEKVTLAVDGLALDVAMQTEDIVPIFITVAMRIQAAMCCRLTPAQKGAIIELFKNEASGTTLAIGDGANDATMIQAADVGIGIIGLEGSQAELASDYAIPRFRHLKRLLAVHGRYALYRNALCVCFSFYKNLVLTTCQVYYAFYSGFTGMTVYDGWLLAVKNTLFTFFPPLFMGCFEKDISEECLECPIAGPQLYEQLSKGLYFDGKTIGMWFATAVFHGTLIFSLVLSHMRNDDTDPWGGRLTGLNTTGTLMMVCVVFTVCGKAMLHLRFFTSVQFVGIIVSVLLLLVFLFAYSCVTNLWGQTSFYLLVFYLFEDPKLYLFTFVTSAGILTVFDLTAVFLQRQLGHLKMELVEAAVMGLTAALSYYLYSEGYGVLASMPVLLWYMLGTTLKGVFVNMVYGHPAKIVPPARQAVSRKSTEDEKKPKIVIVFASQTGTAEMYANNLSREAKKVGFNVRVEDTSDYTGECLYEDSFVVFVVATYGEGEPTDTAKDFHEWLMDEDRANDGRSMDNLKYAVFALGDSQYKHFCQIGKEFDQRIGELGGNRIHDLGLGDSDQNMEEEYDNWKSQLWSRAADVFGIKTKDEFEEAPERQLKLKYHPKPSSAAQPFPVTASSLPPSQKIPCWGKITQNDELLNGVSDRSTKHIEIDCSGTSLPNYEAGDHLGILPANSDEIVQEYFDLLVGEDGNPIDTESIVSLVARDGMSQRNHLPNKVNIKTALKWYFDLQGVPKKSVLRAFTFHTKDSDEQESFRELLKIKKESTDKYKVAVKQARTASGFLQMFKSTQVPVDLFFEMMPRTQPRWYSIASDHLKQGKAVHMCLAVSDGGLCSGYMKGMPVGTTVPCFIRKSTFHLPQRDKSRPSIMIGPGTGVAPMIGFIHRRTVWKEKGNELGECSFYFGCRKSTEDFIYADLMKEAEKSGVITNLRVAFSRDQAEKVYVQHLVAQDGKHIMELINKNANIYICGDAKHMARDVEEALVNILIEHGGYTRDDAEARLNKMEKSQRFLKDVWTSH